MGRRWPARRAARAASRQLARISRASDKKGGQLQGLLGVRQAEGLGSFRVKAEEPEKVLGRQVVDHEYVTRGAPAGLRRTPADSDWVAYAFLTRAVIALFQASAATTPKAADAREIMVCIYTERLDTKRLLV